MSKKILKDFVFESQISSPINHRIDGLRALAKMIARDLVTKHRNTTNKETDGKGHLQILEDCR